MFENGCFLRRQKRFKDDKKEAVRQTHRSTQGQDQQHSISSTSGGSNGSTGSLNSLSSNNNNSLLSNANKSSGKHQQTPPSGAHHPNHHHSHHGSATTPPSSLSSHHDDGSPNSYHHHSSHAAKLSDHMGHPGQHHSHHHHGGGSVHHRDGSQGHLDLLTLSGGHPGNPHHLMHSTKDHSGTGSPHDDSIIMDKMDGIGNNGGSDCGGSAGGSAGIPGALLGAAAASHPRYPLGDSGQLPSMLQMSHHMTREQAHLASAYAASAVAHPFSIKSLIPTEVGGAGSKYATDLMHNATYGGYFGAINNPSVQESLYNSSHLYHHLPTGNAS